MTKEKTVTVPDIGSTSQVDVIEILVKEGDTIQKETPLITLESDKASMEIPSSAAGVIRSIQVKIGDKVSQGDVILTLEAQASSSEEEAATQPSQSSKLEQDAKAPTPEKNNEDKNAKIAQTERSEQSIKVPNIGGASQVDVIEVLVKPGDTVDKDTSLITLESDKASMEIPALKAGIVSSVCVKVGDKVSEGDEILTLVVENQVVSKSQPTAQKSSEPASPTTPKSEQTSTKSSAQERTKAEAVHVGSAYAGPGVRRLAREFGIDLAQVRGSGRKARISKEDLQQFVKAKLSQNTQAFSLPAAASIDFSQFGSTQTKPLNKIKRLTAVSVYRSYVTIPHVTQFDEADITELEAFRKAEVENNPDAGYKLTILAFVCKAVSKALEVYPQFNASLDASGENLIYKQYYNIGIATETPNGLVVPVIKGVNHLSVGEIAKEMARLSAKAREKGLMPSDMNGGCFTISSLGGIGGTAFTPIVNSPEVAILGLSRSKMAPVYQAGVFVPRLMLPLSLSYDHRVIDGAESVRFTRFISESLGDIRRILL